ncbi:MAG: hypothetical protein ACM3MG_02565 [Bacillota bacterium]
MVKAFLFMIFISVSAMAETSLPVYRAVSYLHWKDAKGLEQTASLHVEDKTVRINALEIPKANWKKGQAAIKSLTNTYASEKKACAAGKSYTLRVAKGKKKSVTEQGCTDSARFKELEKSVSSLQQLLPK